MTAAKTTAPVATQYVRTMGVHPTGSGFGWVVCEGPFALLETGLFAPVRRNTRVACAREFGRLLARFQPGELVLEALVDRPSRAKKLGLDLVAVAADRGLSVEAYPRTHVQIAFGAVGAKTREEIAAAVARHFPGLAHRLPPKRRTWEGGGRRLAIFNAAAVVLAHFHNGATAFLNDVRNAA